MLEFLYGLVDFATGRLEPAVQTIAEGTGHTYSAVHEALVRLRKEGFLHWMRRSRPIENPEPGGQQVEQIPNAYALLVPERMKVWLGARLRKPPKPQCDAERRRLEKEEYEAMLAALTAEERHHATWNGDRLTGEALSRIAAALDARDVLKGESGRTGETGGSF